MKSGWEIKKLGDVCDIIGGGTPSKNNELFYNGDIPWATVRDMKSDIISETECSITKQAVEKSSTNVIPKNNVIIATRVGLGKVCLIERDTAINQDLRGIIPKSPKQLMVMYLYWWLKSTAHRIIEEGTGATVQGVKLPFIKSLQIPLPPLADQQRIVTLMDEAFAGIVKATENSKKNLLNARALFESQLQSIFLTKSDGWVEKRLEKLTTKIGSGATPRGGNDSYKNEGVPLIRSLNVHDRYFKVKELAFIDEAQAKKLDNVVVQKGDVLLNITGASVARCCEAPSQFLPARVNQHVSIIRPIGEVISSPFLTYLLTSKPYKERLLDTGNESGATRQAITKAQIQNFSIFHPSLLEQQRIVDQLDALATEAKSLEVIYQKKLDNLAALKQSILQKAFAGELNMNRLAA